MTLDVIMDEFLFEPSTIRVHPGQNVTVRLANDGAIVHTFTLFAQVNATVPVNDNEMLQQFYANNATIVDVSLEGGEEATFQFDAPDVPGNYVLVCIEPGHAEAGMHGLVVSGESAVEDGAPLLDINLVQALFLIALVGTVVFAILYHVRTTRGS